MKTTQLVDLVRGVGGYVCDPSWPPSQEIARDISEGRRGLIIDWGLPETGCVTLGCPPPVNPQALCWHPSAGRLPEPIRSVALRLEGLGGEVVVTRMICWAYRAPPNSAWDPLCPDMVSDVVAVVGRGWWAVIYRRRRPYTEAEKQAPLPPPFKGLEEQAQGR